MAPTDKKSTSTKSKKAKKPAQSKEMVDSDGGQPISASTAKARSEAKPKKSKKVPKSNEIVDSEEDVPIPVSKASKKKKKTDDDSEFLFVPPVDTNDVTEVAAEANAAILGYARVCFADLSDLGKGPVAEPMEVNSRKATTSTINNLIRALGGDPANPSAPMAKMARYLARNAILIAINPDYINVKSLERNPNAHIFPDAQYPKHAAGAINVSKLLNGNHRFLICQRLAGKLYEEFKKAKAAVNVHSQSDTNQPDYANRMAKLLETLSSVERRLREVSSWLVLFYDHTRIMASPNAQPILHSLARNSHEYQAQDSEDAELNMAVNFCFSKLAVPIPDITPDDLELENWKWEASHKPTRRLISLTADRGLFCELVRAWPFINQWSVPCLKVTTVHNWKGHVSPIMEIIFHQGSAALYFLESHYPVPSTFSPQALETLRTSLRNNPPEPIMGLLDTDFFTAVNDAYKKHLYPERESFGLGSGSNPDTLKFQSVFREYIEEVNEVVALWVSQRIEQVRYASSAFPPHTVATLQSLMKRLHWVLVHGLFNSTQFGLHLSTPTPLLCPYLVIDISSVLMLLSRFILLIWEWFEPFYGTNLIFKQLGSSSSVLLATFQHLKPKRPPMEILREIATVIFQSRTTALLQMRSEDGTLAIHPPSASSIAQLDEDAVDYSHIFIELPDFLKSWRHAEIELYGSEDALENVVPNILHVSPVEVEAMEDAKGGRLVINILTTTALPWAHVTPSLAHGRMTQITGYVLQTLWQYVNRTLAYSKHSFFWDLRTALEKIAKSSFEDFDSFWDDLEEDEEVLVPESSPGDLTVRKKISLKSKAAEVLLKTRQVCHDIVDLLCQKEVGAIPVPTGEHSSDFLPHHEKLGIASHRAQMMYSDPTRDRSQEVGPEECATIYAGLRIPPAFKHAPYKFIEVLGEGSRAAQMRQDNANRRQFAKKKSNLLMPPPPVLPPEVLKAESLIQMPSTPSSPAPPVAPPVRITPSSAGMNAPAGATEYGQDMHVVSSRQVPYTPRKRPAEDPVPPSMPATPAIKRVRTHTIVTPPSFGFTDDDLLDVPLHLLQENNAQLTPQGTHEHYRYEGESSEAEERYNSDASPPPPSESSDLPRSSPTPEGAVKLANKKIFFHRK
ncbi:hypothetical protein NLJ89_g7480 [Agrocybe chaxingu]|uniref:Uncharacterized protein n=1 Tax=Agrocybe chaxingu TaxID=84603 RepID=A0A9W8JXA4_9AGAR|nr:hypothetical protein NLJ89_g7480 [Agrocybe chaxingu]